MNRTLPILLALLGGLMALPAAAHAAVTCGFDATTHRLTITADANFDDPGVKRSGSLVLVTANEQPIDCAGPDATVTTADAIDYTDTSTLQNAFRLDLSGGALAPGYTPEGMFGTAEIEIDVDAGGGYDLIVITGSPAADTYRAGTVAPSETRVNLNPGDLIPDADIVGSGVQVVTIYAGAGEDTIDARGGAGTGDPLVPKLVAYGGEDDDTVHAGAVESSMGGSEGDDTLLGGPGLDDILGGEGDDVVDGAGGTHDVVRFSAEHPGVTVGLKPGPQDTKEGMDTLSGFEVLSGTNGDDVLRGSSGAEELKGRGGRDVLSGFDGDDRIDGGDGTDTLAFLGVTGGVSVDLGAAAPQATGADGDDELVGIENVVGGPLADHITGDAGPNVLDGAGSGDVLDGAGGVDTLSYADRPYPVAVRLDGIKNDGADVNGDGISSEAEEGDHAKNIENATGGTEADRLRGSGVANVLVGGGGDDVLDGGLGADILDGGLGIDTLSYAARTTAVAVRLDGSKNDGADPDGDGFSSAAEEGDHAKGIENATGGSGPDRLISSSTVVNVLTGGAGADYLDAKDGSAKVDVLDCGSGADKRRADASDSKTSCETAVAR